VVHILSTVLKRVHRSLKEGGLLYSSQPGDQKTLIEVIYKGEVAFSEPLEESYFRYFLDVTRQTLMDGVEQGLFAIESETTHSSYTEFPSIAVWNSDRTAQADDAIELNLMAERLEKLFPDGIDSLRQHREDWYLLLKKIENNRTKSRP
jgi:hypothetical protein